MHSAFLVRLAGASGPRGRQFPRRAYLGIGYENLSLLFVPCLLRRFGTSAPFFGSCERDVSGRFYPVLRLGSGDDAGRGGCGYSI